MSRRTRLFWLAVCLAAPSMALAQAPTGRVRVTVADPSEAVIPNASVAVRPHGASPESAPLATVTTGETGIAVVENLRPGRYTLRAEFPGFEIIEIRDFEVRAGDNDRTITLPIKQVSEDLTVARDGRTAALDPRGNSFSTVLTREQIAMLPDDPEEMEAALRAMAPPGATFRVDGFTGGRLPPKSQIRSIRLPRMDQFAAQNHGGFGGMMHIDILTQPGGGPLRGSFEMALRDDALNARNPFVPDKGDESLKQGGITLSGGIVPNKSSFSVSAQKGRTFNTGNLLAAMPEGTLAQAIGQPSERLFLDARFDQSLTPDHVLRFSYQRTANENRNLGVGGFELLDRAYETSANDNLFRISENGPLGRRFFSESRLQVRWLQSGSSSSVESPAIRVLDAFTSGGAQRRGGERSVQFEAATDLDYVRGTHAFRAGLLLEGGRYRSDASSNHLGTFTFASLEDYLGGRPLNYSRRIGDPAVEFSNLQIGVYAQDDFRVHPALMLSYGLRYEGQTLLSDFDNFSPRVSVTWSPFEGGATTFRAGWGYFSDWLSTGTWEQTLRVDGFRQQELNVLNPSFPDPGVAGGVAPSNRYLLADGLSLSGSQSMNVGVERRIGQSVRLNATYTHRRGDRMLRARNLNAPVDGVRPDDRFSNVVEVVDDASARAHMLTVSGSLIMLQSRQTFLAGHYTWASSESNTTGAFSLPANGDDLANEWGPTTPRHRFGASLNTRPFGRFGIAVNARYQSGTPYTLTTGADLNGDGVFNDRPVGVGRNTLLTASQWEVGMRLSYAIGFGGPRDSSGSGGGTVVMIRTGGGMPVGGPGGSGDDRYRVELYASAQNLTNHHNYIGYSGIITSPFFQQPTNVMNPRKIELGMRFGF